jgi:hypothetical protein
MDTPKTSEAKRRANAKWDATQDRINCRFKKGTIDQIKALGHKSVNDFIKIAVIEKIEKEKSILGK